MSDCRLLKSLFWKSVLRTPCASWNMSRQRLRRGSESARNDSCQHSASGVLRHLLTCVSAEVATWWRRQRQREQRLISELGSWIAYSEKWLLHTPCASWHMRRQRLRRANGNSIKRETDVSAQPTEAL
eukprot:TRINITY_DN8564_c0_g1_i1.p1 TRINITY_DN8564_c0_g1~~TRINITY_DN8564_c0_g1_i1.p1  ORF type:complete len:128 (+),score=14.05 TRINITY_DN8564_c0_g1_i1:224-607(+)